MCVCVCSRGRGVKFLSLYVAALYCCVCVCAHVWVYGCILPSPSQHEPRVRLLLMSTHSAVTRQQGVGGGRHSVSGVVLKSIAFFFCHADH